MTEFGYQIDKSVVEQFDSRFAKGYMTAPRVVEQRRIREVVRSIGLPNEGIALDFGCGKGDFSFLLKELLPKWRVIGLDISPLAIDKARHVKGEVEFYVIDQFLKASPGIVFDLIFSHHVLEYVQDIRYVFHKFEHHSHPGTKMLHIIPSGDKPSLESSICGLRDDGVNQENGLFFFEHPAHVKRYGAREIESLAIEFNFQMSGVWYVDQFWGALEWITRSDKNFIKKLTKAPGSKSVSTRFRLVTLRFWCFLLYGLRYPFLSYDRSLRRWSWGVKRKLLFGVIVLFYLPSTLVNTLLLRMVDVEWHFRKRCGGGGKMHLLFKRI